MEKSQLIKPLLIPRGSTHGGHYHAYIRDVDGLGNWSHPEDDHVQILADPSSGRVDFIECDSPIELVMALLGKVPEHGMAVDKLGSVC